MKNRNSSLVARIFRLRSGQVAYIPLIAAGFEKGTFSAMIEKRWALAKHKNPAGKLGHAFCKHIVLFINEKYYWSVTLQMRFGYW